MKKARFLAVATAIVMSASPAFAATQFVTNGDFSSTSTTSNDGNFQLTSGNTYGSVTGWKTTGGYNLLFNAVNGTTAAGSAYGAFSTGANSGKEYLAAITDAAAHGNVIAMDGDQSFTKAITQTITGLTVGQTYTLSFDWGAGQLASRTGNTTDYLTYSLGDQSYNTATLSNLSQSFTGWNTVTKNFTATGTSEVLSFLSTGTPTGLPPVALLDNVSLTAAVPEPATWAMMILGFGLVGVGMRSAKRRSDATFDAKVIG